MKPVHTRHQKQSCPKCKQTIDTATGVFEEATPQEGDFAICTSCYCVLRYGQHLQLRLSSLEEAETEQQGLGGQLEEGIAAFKRVKARENKHFN